MVVVHSISSSLQFPQTKKDHRIHLSYEKSVIERIIQYFKVRTELKVLMNIFHVKVKGVANYRTYSQVV